MSQHDYIIDNASGAALRADLNLALGAIATTNKGSTRPSTINAGMAWLDDNTPSSTFWSLNLYDGSDDIPIAFLDVTNNVPYYRAGAGSGSAPGFSFAGDPDTGFYSPAANKMTATCGGTSMAQWESDRYFVGADASANPATDGVAILASGVVIANKDNGVAGAFRRRNSDGSAVEFYRDGILVGTIGVTTTATTYNSASDGRLKDEQEPLEDVWEILEKVQPKRYVWNHVDGRVPGVGFIAQELHKHVPEAVLAGDTGRKKRPGDKGFRQWAVDLSKLVPYLWAAVKGLRSDQKALLAEIESLKGRLAELESGSK